MTKVTALIVLVTIAAISIAIYVGVQMGTGLGKTMASFGVVAGVVLVLLAFETFRPSDT